MSAATTTALTVNLVKTLVGSGLMAMPFVFRADGIALGLATVAGCGVVCGFGFYLQVRVSKYVPPGQATFFSLCYLAYPWLALWFDLLIAFNCFGSGLLYLVLIGELMPQVTGVGSLAMWVFLLLFVLVPLCFKRRLDLLKYTLVLALGAIAYMVLLVAGYFFVHLVTGPLENRGAVHWAPGPVEGVVSTFSVPVFAFAGHQNLFTIINEARDKLLGNLMTVVGLSVVILGSMYLAVGLMGYWLFGDKVGSNIMLMYSNLWYGVAGQGAIAFMVLLLFPLMFHPTRTCVNNVYQWLKTEWEGEPSLQTVVLTDRLATAAAAGEHQALLELGDFPEQLPNQTLTQEEYVIITLVLLMLAYYLAFTVKLFGLVVAVVGATGCTSVAMLVPGVLGFRLLASNHRQYGGTSHPLDVVFKYLALGLALFGCATIVACLYAIFVLDSF